VQSYQYQLLPELAVNEFEALKADIAKHGVLVPVELDQDGTLIDGHHRVRAWSELRAAGVEIGDYPRLVRQFDSEDDRIEHALKLNLQRRHLTREQLREQAINLRKRDWSSRKIGGILGVSHDTVIRWVGADSVVRNLTTDQPAKVVGSDGKKYKATKRKPAVLATSAKEEKQATKLLNLPEEVREQVTPDGASVVTLPEAQKEARKTQAKAKYEDKKERWDSGANVVGDRFDVRFGDFREVLASIPDGSVDAIVTDPPYPDEFLPLWGDLADLAARKLRPGAPLIAWSGQYRIQQVLNQLCGPLVYEWMLCLDMPGANSRFWATQMIQTWKPIVVCSAGGWGPHDWHQDRVLSPKKDQELYEWQQNSEPAVELIERYVPAGGLVVDPFTGVGSFGVAAIKAGRRFIGAELDESRYMDACERIGAACE
jgi:ParB-like chromosome segregation protein Spo0J